MTPLFKKLNLSTQSVVHILNAPASFEGELAALSGITVKRKLQGPAQFALAFVVTLAERDAASAQLAEACESDAVLWLVYPKGSSKKYRCEFNRDSGWPVLSAAGFDTVRMVAVDEDWSALRFRRVEHIKTLSQNPEGAISQAGKCKASASGGEKKKIGLAAHG